MKKAIRTHWKDFVAIIALGVIGVAVGGYILGQQRLRFPLIEEKPMNLKAEFETAQAVTPGQGQTVRVSGVKIGDITKVTLKEGRALVTLSIEGPYKKLIRTNATALLRPKTALKDMFIEVDPGKAPAPVARKGWTMPVEQTEPDVNVDEIFAMLDGDTRDYLRLLLNGAGQGLKGRGDELRELYKRFEPTHKDLARVNGKVAERRQNLRRLVRNLNVLNRELASKDDELAGLVDSSARVFRAFASEEENITQAVDELPEALQETTQTLRKVESFARVLGPSVERLRPAVRQLDDANEALRPMAREGTPILRDQIRPFVRDARPLLADLKPSLPRLAEAQVFQGRSLASLRRTVNMLSYNPKGREGPEKVDRQEGYLFWLGWLPHVGNALFSTSDATGILRPVAIQATCQTLRSTVGEEPELEFLQGLTGALTDPRICPN